MSAKKIRCCLRDEISTNDVAALLHMDARSVQRAVKAGTIQQSRRGCFILGKIIPAYVDHLRDVIANNPDEAALRAAKLRKALADAERAELELALFKNQLHTSDAVLFVWSARIGASRKRLLAVPTRLAPHLVGETDQRKIYDAISREITLALEDVSQLTQKDFAKQDREFLETHRSNGE
jgi:phage terminase Nu1 subunit (DNA packaging protein)